MGERDAALADGGFRLVKGMVGRADERARFDMLESHGFAEMLVFGELVGMNKTNDGKMIASGLEILAERENVCTLRGEILHGGEDFVLFFAETQHHPGFRGHVGMGLLGKAEQLQRTFVKGTSADLAIEASNGLGVVIKDVRFGREHSAEGSPVAAEIGNQDFYLAAGETMANLLNRAGEDAGAAVRLIVAIDTGNHGVAQAHAGGSFGDADGFFFIGGADRFAGRHRAEAASAGANVAEDHEGGSAVLPAFAHVGTARGFADGVEIVGAHDALEILIALAAEEFHPEPIRAGVGVGRRHGRHDAVGNDVERRSHRVRARTFILRGNARGYKRRSERAKGSERLTRGTHKIAKSGNVGAIGANAPGIDGQAQTFGEVQIDASVIQLGKAEASCGLHAIHPGRINRARRTVALPGTAREFIKLFPIAFVPSVHRGVYSSS